VAVGSTHSIESWATSSETRESWVSSTPATRARVSDAVTCCATLGNTSLSTLRIASLRDFGAGVVDCAGRDFPHAIASARAATVANVLPTFTEK